MAVRDVLKQNYQIFEQDRRRMVADFTRKQVGTTKMGIPVLDILLTIALVLVLILLSPILVCYFFSLLIKDIRYGIYRKKYIKEHGQPPPEVPMNRMTLSKYF